MRRKLICFIVLALVAVACAPLARADEAVGYIIFNLTNPPAVGEFDILNQTGPNASVLPDTSFPVATLLQFSNLSLTGSTGTSFNLDADGISWDGSQISALLAGSLTSITLTGNLSTTTLTLSDGSTVKVLPTFSATITDFSGIGDSDYAIIYATTVTPEPGSLVLLVTGCAGLAGFRRRKLQALASRMSGRLMGITLAFAVVLVTTAAAHGAVKLNAWTSPNSGVAGSTVVGVTGSGFPPSINPGGTTLAFAATCGGTVITTTSASSVTPILGTTDRVQFTVPAALSSGAYFVSVSGTNSASVSFSSNCSEIQVTAPTITTATLQNFITTDPLNGNNGLPTSPAAPLKYGAINIGVDVDGNAIQAVDENDIRYFSGHYYLYGPSFTCGAFNYASGVVTGPLIPTTPASFYRYCGLAIYTSDDLMNWKLLTTQYIQDPATGEHYYTKKPRVVYSAATGLYNLWFLNGQSGLGSSAKVGNYYIAQSMTPYGPWSTPIAPTVAVGTLGPVDYEINTGPDGTSYLITSHAGINVFQLNAEKTGTIDNTTVNVSSLGGGIGLSYSNGWWYITGSGGCGNCLASPFYYIYARDPHGPWMNPANGSTSTPVTPVMLSNDSGLAQMHGAKMLPDGTGNMQILVPGTHYRSSPTHAPSTSVAQAGDNSIALAGLYLTPLTIDSNGHIAPLTIASTYQFPLAKAVSTTPPPPYQANLGINSSQSIIQSWQVLPGQSIEAVLPAVSQRTPDPAGKALEQPNLNAPLLATLALSNGSQYSWTIDPRTVGWAPTQVPLNLPAPFTGPGVATLTLSTVATNGGYGVAVGQKGHLPGSQYTAVSSGVNTTLPSAEMLIATSPSLIPPPTITAQPHSLSVHVGDSIGLLVAAQGTGLGYQWYQNGQVILAPDGYNESTTAALRFQNVTTANAGVYTVDVFNQAGSVTSFPVTVEVLP